MTLTDFPVCLDDRDGKHCLRRAVAVRVITSEFVHGVCAEHAALDRRGVCIPEVAGPGYEMELIRSLMAHG